jgi:hypothetical protein
MNYNSLLSLLLLSSVAIGAPLKPDATLTPGAINTEANKSVICNVGYTAGVDSHGNKVRNVPESLKQKVYDSYKIDRKSDRFEIDHLISLQLGGSNDVKNLWPQSYTSQPYNAYMKDDLENKMKKLICDGKISQEQAQKEISEDWTKAYDAYVKPTKK